MKKIINVIDLDNTLVPFDSFRKLVFQQIFQCNIRIVIILFLRVSRLMSADNFKKGVIDILETRPSTSKIYTNFAEIILKDFNYDVFSLVKTNSKKDETINILCSASPDKYVQIVANKLGWIGFGSGYYDSNFINMHGENKERFIRRKYPMDKYIYNFAISDSKSDMGLLKLFDNYKLLKN